MIRIRRERDDDGQRMLDHLCKRFVGKMAIIVDEDVNIHDPDAIYWALSYAMQPYRDVRIQDIPLMPLDPSLVPPDQNRGLGDAGEPIRSTGLLIDATRDWDYPPVSLPRQEFMERALTLWQQAELPELKLKTPWYGYELGRWSDEERLEADLAVQGRYYETGEKQAATRRRTDD